MEKELKNKFTNQNEAKEYMLTSLKEKYEMDFEILGNEIYENYGPIYGDGYSCKVAPSDNKEQEANAKVTQSGELSDDWAVYLFAEEAELKAEEICKEKDYIIEYDISLEAPATTHQWKVEEGIDTYLLKSGAYDEITITLESGKDDDEYVSIIKDFLEELYQLDINTTLKAKVEGEEILMLNVKVLGKSKTEPYTDEEIRDNIENMKIVSSVKRKAGMD